METDTSPKGESICFLDCTLRDGGYYNDWDFSDDLIARYLQAVKSAGVDVVELGFRFVKTEGFKGACAYATDDFLRSLPIPEGLDVAVMLNASDLFISDDFFGTLEMLFPEPAADTPVTIVRVACHAREFVASLPAAQWLHERGYRVGFNIMQIVDRSREEVIELAIEASKCPVEVLYFADSMGGMSPEQTREIIGWLREGWDGPIGVHTHDNMGLALGNTLAAIDAGATWVDSTVTGMGRGPGNALTEELALELEDIRAPRSVSLSGLLDLVVNDFDPMKVQYGWGTNPFYYLSGKYGIHPTYVQAMLSDRRFGTDDILAVLNHLRSNGGKKYDANALHGARQMVAGAADGDWSPAELLEGRPVLILGNGSSVKDHKEALERFIGMYKPLVIGLNAVSNIDDSLIDLRLACHPLRLLADSEMHSAQKQSLVTPTSALPQDVQQDLSDKTLLNYGLSVEAGAFEAGAQNCVLPSRLVAAYAIAVGIAGRASHLYLAGFDGFTSEDPRNHEMRQVLDLCMKAPDLPPVTSLTKTRYPSLKTLSVYGLIR